MSDAALAYRVSRVRRLLEWVVRARSSASAVVHNTLSQSLLFVLYFINGVVVARGLGSAGRGELTAMMVWPSLFGAVFSIGLPTAFIYHAKRDPEAEAPLFTAAVVLLTGCGVLATGVAFVMLPAYMWRYDAATIFTAQMLMVTVPQVLLGFLVAAFLQVRHRFDLYNLLQYGPTIVTLVTLLALTVLHRLTPAYAALCYVVPMFIAVAAMFAAVVRRLKLDVRGLAHNARRLLSYGGRAAGGNIIGIIAQQFDQVLVVGFFSPSQLGTYTVALSVSRVMNVAYGATYVTMISKAAAMSGAQLTAVIGRALRLSALATLLGSAVLAAAMPVVLPHAYGGEFVSAIAVSDTLLIEVNVSGWATIMALAFLASNRPATVTFLQGMSTAITVGCMLLLVPRFALQGAAVSLIVGAAFRVVVFAVLYRRVVGVAASGLLAGARDDATYLAGVLRTQLRGTES